MADIAEHQNLAHRSTFILGQLLDMGKEVVHSRTEQGERDVFCCNYIITFSPSL